MSPSEGDSGCVADMAMDIENIVANTVLVKARHCECRFLPAMNARARVCVCVCVCVCTAYVCVCCIHS